MQVKIIAPMIYQQISCGSKSSLQHYLFTYLGQGTRPLYLIVNSCFLQLACKQRLINGINNYELGLKDIRGIA
jgi:hypothetical protein